MGNHLALNRNAGRDSDMHIANRTDVSEQLAALDEVAGVSHRAPLRIPAGIEAAPPSGVRQKLDRKTENALRRPLGQLDTTFARRAAERVQREALAHADASPHPEDALIALIDRASTSGVEEDGEDIDPNLFHLRSLDL